MGFFVPFRIAQPFVVLNLWCENGAGIAGPITGMAQVASQTPLAQSPTLGSMTNAYIPLFGLGGRSLV